MTFRKALPFVLLLVAVVLLIDAAATLIRPYQPSTVYAQAPTANCSAVFTFTASGALTSQSNLNGATAQTCAIFGVTYSSTSTLSATVQFETSPDNTTFTAVPNSICTPASSTVQPPCLVFGANPMTTAASGMEMVKAYNPYWRINVTATTGTGTGTIKVVGYILTATGGGSGANSGTVTSVAESFTGGLISVGGSPITSSGTLALTVAGTSGGIPYFSGASTWASSAALTANGVVLGGGAGSAPTVTGADSTTTHALFATAGAPAFRAVAAGDIPTLNQNTTGTAANVTGIVAEANGGTGANNTVGAAGHVLRSNATHYVDAALACADLSNGAASCSTDTTNASNISSGTLAAARVATLNQNTTGTAGGLSGTALGGDVTNSGNTVTVVSSTNLKGSKIYPSADGTTAIQVQKADNATAIVNVDTTNGKLGVGAGVFSMAATVAGAADAGLSRIAAAKVGVGNGTAADVSGTLQATGLETATLFPSADSTTAVKINKADNATAVLTVDTTNSKLISAGAVQGPTGAAGAPAFAFTGATNSGLYAPNTVSVGLTANGTQGYKWAQNTGISSISGVIDMNANADTYLCRSAAKTINSSSSTSCGDAAGTFKAAGLIVAGTKFTTTGCSVSATSGGATAGTYTSGTTGACTVVITLNGATGLTAPTGWSCFASDQTTPANLMSQSASNTTTATITGTTVTGDVVSFGCLAY